MCSCVRSRLTILLGKAGCLQEGDLSVHVQVLLVATQDDDNVLAGQHPGICQPVGQGVVGFPAGHANTTERSLPVQRGREGDTEKYAREHNIYFELQEK